MTSIAGINLSLPQPPRGWDNVAKGAAAGVAVGGVAGLALGAMGHATGLGVVAMGAGGLLAGAATGGFGTGGAIAGVLASGIAGGGYAFARFGMNDISPFIAAIYGGTALLGAAAGAVAAHQATN